MANDISLVFRPGNLTGHAHVSVEGDHSVPQTSPGAISLVNDKYGFRVLQYVKNVSGSALAKGELMAYASDTQNTKTTTVSNITSGTRTSAVTSGLTAGRHDGMVCFVLDNDDVAGAAPEGEFGFVANNTATVITLEPDYPLSTALAANDDLELVATYQVEDTADGDEAWTVAGVVLANDGITNGNYGWIHRYGWTPAKHGANAISEGDPIVAGAAIVDAFGTDGQELWVGIAGVSTSTDEALKHTLADIRVWASAGPGGSP